MEATVSYLLILQKIYRFEAKDSEIQLYILCLGNTSKDLTIYNMKKKGWRGSVKVFSVEYNPIGTNDVLDIHIYFMKQM